MRFRLSTIPAGIPSWFIARSHRFSIGRHWRHGAVFADAERKHLGLVRASSNERLVELTVRGPYPQNFFALLRDGLEVTLARFPGLEIKRLIPCPCGDGSPCATEFDYQVLLKRLEKRKNTIECQQSFREVSIPKLLSGWGAGRQEELLEELDRKVTDGFGRQEELFREQAALIQRNFTAQFKAIQGLEESHCPNVFLLRPLTRKRLRDLFTSRMELHLLCQAPGEWHLTTSGGRYEFQQPAEWFRAMLPYLRALVQVLRCASQLVGRATCSEWIAEMGENFDRMMELVDKFPEAREVKSAADTARADGSALRALRKLLDELDKSQMWGGLRKVYTPEGHYLWLCPEHAAVYQR
jgi:hypothetical protein